MNAKNLLKISLFWTLYLSARFHGRIIVSRGTQIRLARGARINLTPGSCLRLGPYRFTPTRASLCMMRDGRLTIDGDVEVFRGTRILIDKGAHLEIGDKSYINFNSTVTCFEHISIGSGCAISWNVNILDGNVHELTVAGTPRPRKRPLAIGDNVWIGTEAMIVGATIGHGSVIGAGSVVTSDVPPEVVAAGNPARVVRKDISWRM